MFNESAGHSQPDALTPAADLLTGATKEYYLKEDSRHHIFREQIVNRIDESVFSVLYSGDEDKPNASIRVLAGMMLLKEIHDWNDVQLFEKCGFDLLVRSALGLMSLEDDIPSPLTYYRFRRKIIEYGKEHSVDLFMECLSKITQDHIMEIWTGERRVRIDSKLVGNSLALYSYYELIHETLHLFINERKEHIFKKSLPKEVFRLIEYIQNETGKKVLYRSTKTEINTLLVEMGNLIFRFIKLFKEYDYGQYRTLKTVFEQQYLLSGGKTVLPLENEKVYRRFFGQELPKT